MDLVDRVAHRLKLRDLRLLDTVVRWGSMAKAAHQLNLSQPAISKAIAEMEHVLGVRLVDRGRQGVEPTPHGLALLKRGVAIYDELRQGVAEIEHLSDPTAGEVRIAAPEPMSAGLLAVLIAQFTRKYPRASVYVAQTPVASLQFRTPRYADLRGRMAATERYFTILPHSMLHFSAGRLALKALPIKLKVAPLNVGIVTLKKRTVSPAASEFIKMARDIIKPLKLS
jgi:molybdate transport repressor ModE-like protein